MSMLEMQRSHYNCLHVSDSMNSCEKIVELRHTFSFKSASLTGRETVLGGAGTDVSDMVDEY